jgi:hypothetical protein
MSGINGFLSEMDGVIEDLKRTQPETARKQPRERAAIILQNRQRFISALSKLYEEIKTDPKLAGNPALAAEFTSRLSDVRKKLADLQAKWRMVTVEADFDGYARESGPVAEGILAFVRWARDAYFKA